MIYLFNLTAVRISYDIVAHCMMFYAVIIFCVQHCKTKLNIVQLNVGPVSYIKSVQTCNAVFENA